jgi:hypothetical protein
MPEPMSIIHLEDQIVSSTRLFPASCQTRLHKVPLSITDASVANFAPCRAVWFYDTKSHSESWISSRHLKQTLEKTLDTYPWYGSLQWVNYDPSGGHTRRHGRLTLTYGTRSDPGAEFVIANSPKSLLNLLPHATDRYTKYGYWNASVLPLMKLFPATRLALGSTEPNAPCLCIQITTFACGIIAVAIKVAHVLADATTLARFAHDWAAISRTVLLHKEPLILSTVFNPELLDHAAAGDIDAAQPDPVIIKKARDLPMHRYDWFASNRGSPFPPREVPPEVNPASIGPPGTLMPWSEWDINVPVSQYLFHFSGAEIKRMWTACTSSSEAISRHDALVAHLWILINRARQLNDAGAVHLDITIGLRQRFNPPLPETFAGSPITIGGASLPCSALSDDEAMPIASRKIRDVVRRFDDEACRDFLHDAAHEICAQRLWRAFLGCRHVVLTSWLHLGMYEIDFGWGKPKHVDSVMSVSDGIVAIMEAPDLGEAIDGKHIGRNHWSDDGVDVSITLESRAMERLLADPLLRIYI